MVSQGGDVLNLLVAEKIKKTFDEKLFLNIERLEIRKGQINGFLGRNGAGKSTTIKIIMGILPKDDGNLLFENQEILFDDQNFKLQVGYCPDYPAVFENLTMVEHFEFIAYLYKVRKDESFVEKIHTYIEDFELTPYKEMKLKQLSKGNRQKVAIISSVLHEPKLLIYDEPTLGLDPFALKQFKRFMQHYVKRGGTVFLSSHALDIITEVADNVTLIHEGNVIGQNIRIDDVIAKGTDLEAFMLESIKGVG